MNQGRPLLGRGSGIYARRMETFQSTIQAKRTGKQQCDARGTLMPFDYEHAYYVARELVKSVGLTPERVREIVASRPKTETLGEPERISVTPTPGYVPVVRADGSELGVPRVEWEQ